MKWRAVKRQDEFVMGHGRDLSTVGLLRSRFHRLVEQGHPNRLTGRVPGWIEAVTKVGGVRRLADGLVQGFHEERFSLLKIARKP